MADVPGRRDKLQEEEVDFKSGLSEQLFTKLAENQNFVFSRNMKTKEFQFNGPYRLGLGFPEFDGAFFVAQPMQIQFISGHNLRSGSSGTSTLDLRWFNNGVDQGSFLSTKPSFDFNSPDDAYFIQDVVTPSTIYTGTGITVPVASRTTFPAGSLILCKLDAAMAGAEGLTLSIDYVAINADEVVP